MGRVLRYFAAPKIRQSDMADPATLPPLTAEEEAMGTLTVLVMVIGVFLFVTLLILTVFRFINPPPINPPPSMSA